MGSIGYIFLLLALFGALFAAFAYFYGARNRQRFYMESARGSLYVVCGLTSLSVLVLFIAILTHNFQLEYVASYTSRDMPWFYLVSTLWAGNNGSLLFWAWLLSLFAVVLAKQKQSKELVSYASTATMLTQAFFLLLLLTIANPFQTLGFTPADGRGLNPMLENPGMILHPPLLLAGYVGLTMPFALAIAALMSRKPGAEWLSSARRWTLFAWLLLGVGNIIGAWWAYVELGWGGYWAWDPVENAGLMPWLIATAFLHSLMMEKRKGMLRVWNMTLIILAFNLAIFGTFVTRSGILSSVHTFSDSRMVPFFMVFLTASFLGSLIMLYSRKDALQDTAETESLISREGTFQLNNLLLVGATLMIFLGTVYPAVFEAVRGVKINVGASFFNQVDGPLFLMIILLIGICTATGWQRVSAISGLLRKLLPPLFAALLLNAVIFLLGMTHWLALIAFLVCGFVFFTVISQWFAELKARRQAKADNYFKAFWDLFRRNRPHYGAYLVHIAIILMAAGVIGSSFYAVEKEAVLKPGEAMNIGDYTLTYQKLVSHETPSAAVVTASLAVSSHGSPAGIVTPEKIFHRSYEQPVTEVAIRTNLARDLYVILVGWEQDGTASFQVLINPLVIWIWIGGGVFLLGGLVAFWPERPQQPVTPQRAPGRKKTAAVEADIEKQVQQLRKKEKRFCPNCKAPLAETARFCPRCGKKLS